MIEFLGVTKSFDGREVLSDVTFRIPEGEIAFIIGRSGVGKSVTLKNIVGLMKPDSGEIRVDGMEVTSLTEGELHDVRRKCGMVFQFPALLDSLSVGENIAFGIRAHGISTDEAVIRKTVLEKLELVNLSKRIVNRMPTELSFGMQKRAAIARAIAVGPKYLLFDEPTTGLDPITTNAINALISDLSRRLKVTSLVVSHDMHCALDIADRILLIDGGKIQVDGTTADFMKSSVPLAREFLVEAKAKRKLHARNDS